MAFAIYPDNRVCEEGDFYLTIADTEIDFPACNERGITEYILNEAQQ